MPDHRHGRDTLSFRFLAPEHPVCEVRRPKMPFDADKTDVHLQVSVETPLDFHVPSATTIDRATLTVLSGVGAGRTYTIDRPCVVIGRDEEADVSIDDGAVSRLHAQITRSPEGAFSIEDLASTNGTFVQAVPVKRARLATGDRIHIGPHVALRFATTDEEEETLRRRLYDASTRDALTGLCNRFAFRERLEVDIENAKRSGVGLSLMMIDIDHFKMTNDELGHLIGDQVLYAVAQRLLSAVRTSDLVARFGGDEFLVVSRAAEYEATRGLAERLRVGVRATPVPTRGGPAFVTVSIGVASLSECPQPDADGLLALADERMYSAKRRGRNCVCVGDER